MEKKYLELVLNGNLIGAFEDVKVFEERDNGNEIYLESADGNYTIRKNQNGYYNFNGIPFNEYNYCCRRTLRSHTDNLNPRMSKQVNIKE